MTRATLPSFILSPFLISGFSLSDKSLLCFFLNTHWPPNEFECQARLPASCLANTLFFSYWFKMIKHFAIITLPLLALCQCVLDQIVFDKIKSVAIRPHMFQKIKPFIWFQVTARLTVAFPCKYLIAVTHFPVKEIRHDLFLMNIS